MVRRSGRLGGATAAGRRGVLWSHPKARGCPSRRFRCVRPPSRYERLFRKTLQLGRAAAKLQAAQRGRAQRVNAKLGIHVGITRAPSTISGALLAGQDVELDNAMSARRHGPSGRPGGAASGHHHGLLFRLNWRACGAALRQSMSLLRLTIHVPMQAREQLEQLEQRSLITIEADLPVRVLAWLALTPTPTLTLTLTLTLPICRCACSPGWP